MHEGTIHVLLVEDDQAHAELVRRAFEEYADQFELRVAGSLGEAQACLSECPPGLVIADLVLPDGRGIELLPAEGEDQPYPVVMITSHGDEEVAVRAIKAGALDYVVKTAQAMAAMPRIAQRILREWGHILERRQAQQELQESERRYRRLFEQSNDAILVHMLDGKLVDANPQACQMLGYGKHELLQLPIPALHVEEERESARQALQTTLEKGAVRFVSRFQKADGSSIFVDISAGVIDPEKGLVQSIVRDITPRVQAEQEREKLIGALQEALAKIKTLRGLLPICSSCKKIRDDEGYWHQVEVYVRDHSEAEFTHGLCPDCFKRLYPELFTETE